MCTILLCISCSYTLYMNSTFHDLSRGANRLFLACRVQKLQNGRQKCQLFSDKNVIFTLVLISYNNAFLLFPPVVNESGNNFPISSFMFSATFSPSSVLLHFYVFLGSAEFPDGWGRGGGRAKGGGKDTFLARFTVIFQVKMIHKNSIASELNLGVPLTKSSFNQISAIFRLHRNIIARFLV